MSGQDYRIASLAFHCNNIRVVQISGEQAGSSGNTTATIAAIHNISGSVGSSLQETPHRKRSFVLAGCPTEAFTVRRP